VTAPSSAPDAAQAGPRAAEPDTSLAALGRGLLEEVAAVLRERLRLLALEGQQFALAAGQLLTLGVLAAVFVLTAWFVLIAGALALAVELGVSWPAALAGGVVANLIAAGLTWLAMKRLLVLMMFPATLRRMRLARESPLPTTESAMTPLQAAADSARLQPSAQTTQAADDSLRSAP
jgi:hypothetical protein